MIPHWLSVLILLGTGAALLKVAHKGWQEGRVRAGSSLRGVWGLLALVGMAPDLRVGEV